MSLIQLTQWFTLALLAAAIRFVSFRYVYGIQKFKGPLLASFTDFWRFFRAYRNSLFPSRHLHEDYGDVVRVGPNALCFRDPQAIRDIFGAGKNWEKSGLYAPSAPVSRGEWAHTLFSSTDQTWHRNVRRAMNPFFSQTTVTTYEPLVESTVEPFLAELENRFANKDGDEGCMDVYTWMTYFTFDVMSDLTYSQRHGFIARGEDVYGIIGWVEKFLAYGFWAGQMPWIDRLFRHNPFLMWLERRGWYAGNTFPGAIFALQRLAEREQEEATTGNDTKKREDLLDKFRKAKKERPEHITIREVLGLSLSTIIAGSEPNAVSLTSILYYVLRTPGCYGKLQDELFTRLPNPASSKCPQTPFTTARSLPYLHACIQEAFRLHPPFAMNIERLVPQGGATICNHYIPGGTIVSVSPWVTQRDKATFGDDVDDYRPERWITQDEEKVRAMERAMFLFGSGNHICLGRNIVLMEIYKLVPSLLRMFEISMVDPEKEWTVDNWVVSRQKGFEVRIKRRWNLGR